MDSERERSGIEREPDVGDDPRSGIEREPDVGDDPLVRREEQAAAAEAARVGGQGPDYEGDEAERPLDEGGEGVAEGFEESERELMESAEHGEPRFAPDANEPEPEAESDRATAVYGEPDEIDPTEVVRDPREGEDDPGAGPGLAPDR